MANSSSVASVMESVVSDDGAGAAWPYSPGTTIGIAFGSCCVWLVFVLLRPILFPTILCYPWPIAKTGAQRRIDKTKTVVLAGSYNPPHKGHLAMLGYLSDRYGGVIAVVGANPNKAYLVSPSQRAELIRKMVKSTPTAVPVRVEVVEGYIWRRVKPEGASLFVRGIRSWERDGREERALQILNTWGPLLLGPLWWPLPTLFLEGKPEFNHVSSTLIRELCCCCCSRGGPGTVAAAPPYEKVAELVPEVIAEDVIQLYSQAKMD